MTASPTPTKISRSNPLKAFGLTGVLGLISAGLGAAHASACTPVSGADEIFDSPGTHYVIVGDYHGTTEIPLLVADLVCDALARGLRVDVGLEWPASAAADVDAYLASDGGPSHRGRLVRALGGGNDGRVSEAMMELIDSLRRLKAIDSALSVTPVQPDAAPLPDQERAMSELIMTARQEGEMSIVLVGNVHAMKAAPPQMSDLQPMASYLPRDATVSVNTVGYFGEAWNCRRDEATGEPLCQAWQLRVGNPGPRRLVIAPEEGGRYDGRYSVGGPFSASPPATMD